MKRLLTGSIIVLALTVALPALAADTTKPVVGPASPTSATVGEATTISATVSDADSGIASCNLYVTFQNAGAMNVAGGIASKAFVFTEDGEYVVYVFCRDAAGNFDSGPNTAVTVRVSSGGGGGTSTSLSVSAITPATAFAGLPVTLSATISGSGSASSCVLVVDGIQRGTMALSSGTASISYTFPNSGTYPTLAQCTEVGGSVAFGPNTAVAVTAAPQPTFGSRLVKLACPPDANAFHACRSVYYQGIDGKRHAFPSDKVYFSWYRDFMGIETLDSTSLAALPLGKNVTFRPGVKLVKFETVNKVYAVARGGVLRWITSEDAARSLYGDDWNTKVNDLADVFFGNYTIGTDIVQAGDFSPAAETAAVSTIDANI